MRFIIAYALHIRRCIIARAIFTFNLQFGLDLKLKSIAFSSERRIKSLLYAAVCN